MSTFIYNYFSGTQRFIKIYVYLEIFFLDPLTVACNAFNKKLSVIPMLD